MPADPRFPRGIPATVQKQFDAGVINGATLEQAVTDYFAYWDKRGGDFNDRIRNAVSGKASPAARIRDAMGQFSQLEPVNPETGEKRPVDEDGKPVLSLNERIRAAAFDPASSPSHTIVSRLFPKDAD